MTAISRTNSKATFPSSVKVIRADYTSLVSLKSALKGQDAVVCTVGNDGFVGETLIIDAAISVGVKRFLPSEFGSDISNPKVAALPVFGHKVAVRKHLEEKVRSGADITYTYVINSGFLDWGLENNFLLDWKEGKPTIYDGGDKLLTTTTLSSVAQGVVGILSHPDETKNRSVYIGDLDITQNRLLEIAKKVAPEKKWNPVHTTLDKVLETANQGLAKGDFSVFPLYIFVALLGDGYGGRFEKKDNELLGLKGKTEKEVEEIWKRLLLGGN